MRRLTAQAVARWLHSRAASPVDHAREGTATGGYLRLVALAGLLTALTTATPVKAAAARGQWTPLARASSWQTAGVVVNARRPHLRFTAGASVYSGALNPQLSYGAVLHNPNRGLAAGRVLVRLALLDDRGEMVGRDSEGINLIPPRSASAVGAGDTLARYSLPGRDAEQATHYRIRVGVGRWVRWRSPGGSLRATHAEMEQPNLLSTLVTIASTFGHPVYNVGFVAIYRAQSQIVGGDGGCIDTLEPHARSTGETGGIEPFPHQVSSVAYVHFKLPNNEGPDPLCGF